MRTSERDTAVVLADYCASWPGVFATERTLLCEIFGLPAGRIEHIGSTAIPGLRAKPIIDILVGADSLSEIESCIAFMVAAGYHYVEEFNALIPERRYFDKDRRFHVHAVAHGGNFWVQQLAFRDALRADASPREEYASLKRRLAQAHANDVAAYTDAKAPFIRSVLQRQRP
jgi:GrpB-like predicted nucleotidyltransferase (UPF0157 family)